MTRPRWWQYSVRAAGLVPLLASGAEAQAVAHGLHDCASKPPAQYSVVFDASSSLRHQPRLRASVKAEYANVLDLLSGVLCTGDLLRVYAFSRDSTQHMSPLFSVTSETRDPHRISMMADSVLRTHSQHTDLELVVSGIRRDVLSHPGTNAVFLVTDGSLFPYKRRPDDRTVAGLRTRLDGLARYINDSIAVPRENLFVVGVNSENAPAIDPDLQPRFPRSTTERTWTWRGARLDLRDDKGADLLATAFGHERFFLSDSLSLWNLLLGGNDGLWIRAFEYVNSDVELLRDATPLHLLFVPKSATGARSCINDPGIFKETAAEIRHTVAGLVFCSVLQPSRAALDHVRSIASEVAFSQERSLRLVHEPKDLPGLQHFVFESSDRPCDLNAYIRHFTDGDAWPPSHQKAAEAAFRRSGQREWSAPMELIRLERSGCIVASMLGRQWNYPQGEYQVQVTTSNGRTIENASFAKARDSVSIAFLRPGGFPFPSDRIALLRICVVTRPRLAADEEMWVLLDGEKALLLTESRGGTRCPNPPAGADSASVVAFSGLVTLRDSERVKSARVVLSRRNSTVHRQEEPHWTPVILKIDGRLFLSWTALGWCFALGVAIQLAFSVVAARRASGDSRRLRPLSIATAALVSGLIVAVAAEFAMLVYEADVAEDKVPVIFALSVIVHMVKLVAAALIAEHVAEFAITEGASE